MVVGKEGLTGEGLTERLQGVNVVHTHGERIVRWVVGHWRVLEQRDLTNWVAHLNGDLRILNAFVQEPLYVLLVCLRFQLLIQCVFYVFLRVPRWKH